VNNDDEEDDVIFPSNNEGSTKDYVTYSWRGQSKRKRRTSKNVTGNKSNRYTMSMKLNSILASVILVCYNSKMI